MISTIRKIAIDLPSDAGRLIRSCSRRSLAVLAALLVLGLTGMAIDWSAELTAEEVAVVRAFVLRTGSAAVRNKYNEKITGGLTINEVQQITELAKRQEPEYGLISDQKNNK